MAERAEENAGRAKKASEKAEEDKVNYLTCFRHRLLIVLQSQKAEKATENAARAAEKAAEKAEKQTVR